MTSPPLNTRLVRHLHPFLGNHVVIGAIETQQGNSGTDIADQDVWAPFRVNRVLSAA